MQTLSWIQTQTVAASQQVRVFRESQENIDLGETEAIILALELKADLLLMDERRGRAVAMSYGLQVTGLLGVLMNHPRRRYSGNKASRYTTWKVNGEETTVTGFRRSLRRS